MRNILVVFGLLLALVAGYNWIAGPRDPVWRVPLSKSSAFTLASTILARGDVKGCGDLQITSQYPGLFQIQVLCNGQRTHLVTYKPSFEVDGKHVEFTWLENAYCVKLPDGKWEQSYLDFSEAAYSATALSEKLEAPTKIYAASNYDVGGTTKNDKGEWGVARFIETAKDEERRGCELAELE